MGGSREIGLCTLPDLEVKLERLHIKKLRIEKKKNIKTQTPM